MLSRSIRILNFDDSVIKQHNLLSRYKNEIIDFKALASDARLWINMKTKKEIEERVSGSLQNAVTFLGSGDFHHISSLLINQLGQPVSVIIFDFHPDMDTLPPHMGCGSWVNQILRNKNVAKCILAGVSSDDISSGHLQNVNLSYFKDNRVEIYPYRHEPSNVFLKRVPDNISIRVKRNPLFSTIYWNELEGRNLGEFFLSVLKRIPTKQVYISIDKDCLNKENALTNWEEGYLSLEELMLMLKLIKENFDIAGADITGEHSGILIKDKFKNFLSRLDHPKRLAADNAPAQFITAINEQSNLKLLELLTSP